MKEVLSCQINTILVSLWVVCADSYNLVVAKAMTKLFPTNFTFKFINIGELPLYNQDADQNVPPVVANFKSQIKACDGIIFATQNITVQCLAY